MKKRYSIIIIILLIILLGGGVWFGLERNKKEEIKKVERENIVNSEKISEEEIQKLKNNPNLVWYEVPEIGVKFQVSAYGEKALDYKRVYDWGNDIKSVVFYDVLNKKNNNGCGYYKEVRNDIKEKEICDLFVLFRMTSKYNEESRNDAAGFDYFCGSNKIIKSIGISGRGLVLQDRDDVICLNAYQEEKYFNEYGIKLSSFKSLD